MQLLDDAGNECAVFTKAVDGTLTLASPVATPAANDNDTSIATTAFVQGQGQGYLVYDATLTQSGDGSTTATSGTLVVGKRYAITTFVAGDDFANVATVISGTINTTGCEFLATGTTPTVWTNGSTLTDTSAPVATVGQNNIGQTMTWAYVSPGVYTVTAGAAAFTANKTQVVLGSGDWSASADFVAIGYTRTSTTVITINTKNVDMSGPNATLGNDLLTETAIRIVIFP